jgi:hypothetical protein
MRVPHDPPELHEGNWYMAAKSKKTSKTTKKSVAAKKPAAIATKTKVVTKQVGVKGPKPGAGKKKGTSVGATRRGAR